MGVHGLWELLAPVGRRISVEALGNKKLAIDASIWIIQFMKAMRDERGDMIRNAHLLGFFRRICKLLFLRVKPIFVFDGGTPFLKRRTVLARRRQREKAQFKIRKTAEKLLLNHLKLKKLEELAVETKKDERPAEEKEEQRQHISIENQEAADALLAASLAKEWQQENVIDDDYEEEEQAVLPVVDGKVDAAVLSSLPPSMQLDLLVQMRENLVAENRQKFLKVAKAPSSFSQLQIQAYLKTVAFRREMNEVQKAASGGGIDGIPSARIASEANREFIFSSSTHKRESTENVTNSRDEHTTSNNTTSNNQPLLETAVPPTDTSISKENDVDAGENSETVVQTYVDDNGHERVSRIRGMGVRMTRDLQWNLYLMKDKEREVEAVKDDSVDKFESLVEEPTVNPVNSDDGGCSDVEWEDGVDEGNVEMMNGADVRKYLGGKASIEVTLEDNGLADSDDEMFKRLLQEPETEKEGPDVAVPVVDDGLVSQLCDDDDDEQEIEWEDEGPTADNNSGDKIITVEDEIQNLPSEIPSETQNLPKTDNYRVVSEEQAEIEEAIRRSLEEYGSAPSKNALRIKEPEEFSRQQQKAIQDTGKGKAVVTDDATAAYKERSGAAACKERDGAAACKERESTAAYEGRCTADMCTSFVHETAQTSTATGEQASTETAEQMVAPNLREQQPMENSMNDNRTADEICADLEEERTNLLQEESELLATQKKNERTADTVTSEMFSECQELLQMFGVPYVVAPMEAEAQCAFLDDAKLVDGVITDDSDVFLFGGRSVYKNIFDGHKYVETYYMKDVEGDMGLNRDKMIRMALLLGSDYTEGISGIGIVNAIEVVNAFPEENGLDKFKEWIDSPDFGLLERAHSRSSSKSRKEKGQQTNVSGNDDVPELDENKQRFIEQHRSVSKNWNIPDNFPSKAVIAAYTSPQVDKSMETFQWGRPDIESLRKFCYEKFGWTRDKADEVLVPVLKEYDRRETQLRLDAFYSFNERFAKIRSRRIQKAVSGITGGRVTNIMETPPSPSPTPSPAKKGKKRKAAKPPSKNSNRSRVRKQQQAKEVVAEEVPKEVAEKEIHSCEAPVEVAAELVKEGSHSCETPVEDGYGGGGFVREDDDVDGGGIADDVYKEPPLRAIPFLRKKRKST